MCDPACGTGGFLVSSYEWLIEQGRSIAPRSRETPEIRYILWARTVQRPRRLTLMNLHLHGLEPHIAFGDSRFRAANGSTW
jgi:type I restriction enzyme M protein